MIGLACLAVSCPLFVSATHYQMALPGTVGMGRKALMIFLTAAAWSLVSAHGVSQTVFRRLCIATTSCSVLFLVIQMLAFFLPVPVETRNGTSSSSQLATIQIAAQLLIWTLLNISVLSTRPASKAAYTPKRTTSIHLRCLVAGALLGASIQYLTINGEHTRSLDLAISLTSWACVALSLILCSVLSVPSQGLVFKSFAAVPVASFLFGSFLAEKVYETVLGPYPLLNLDIARAAILASLSLLFLFSNAISLHRGARSDVSTSSEATKRERSKEAHVSPHAQINQGRNLVASLDQSGILSGRETEVLSLLLAGKTRKEIASELHLSQSSVSTYAQRAKDKLNLTERAAGNHEDPTSDPEPVVKEIQEESPRSTSTSTKLARGLLFPILFVILLYNWRYLCIIASVLLCYRYSINSVHEEDKALCAKTLQEKRNQRKAMYLMSRGSSKAEAEALVMAANGASVQASARLLYLSPATVLTYRCRGYKKFRVKGKEELRDLLDRETDLEETVKRDA